MRHRVFIESKLAKIVEFTDWKKTLNMNKINRIFWLYQRYVSKRPIRILCRIKYYSVCQFAPFGLESHQSKRRFLEYNLPEMSAENSPFSAGNWLREGSV